MFSRTRFSMFALFVAAFVVAAACGDDAAEVPASPTTVAVATTIEAPVAEVSDPGAIVPSPTREVNESTAVAEETSPRPALSTVEVVKILRPSVVQVTTETLQMGAFNQPIPQTGVGTGIVLDAEGHILTNNHVIAGARRIVVALDTGESFPAKLVGSDVSTDLAVIKIEASGLTPAKLGDSSSLEVGEDVIAIGHALGLRGGPTVSKGVVSALGRTIGVNIQTSIIDLIQTDAAINPGNSGGPLANSRAEVVGINSAIFPGTQAIGFAINIDDAKVVAAQLIEQGYVERGFLGITPFNLIPALAQEIGVPLTDGIAIMRVIALSGADNAGLEVGDVIVQLEGREIRNTGDLSKFLLSHPPGETVKVVYFRGVSRVETEIDLGGRPQG